MLLFSDFPIDYFRQGAHYSIIFGLILKKCRIGILGFHIAVLSGIAKRLGENALCENLRVGGLCHTGQLLVGHQPGMERIQQHPVTLGKGALVLLIDFLNNLVQRLLGVMPRRTLLLGCLVDAFFFLERDRPLKGLLQLIKIGRVV